MDGSVPKSTLESISNVGERVSVANSAIRISDKEIVIFKYYQGPAGVTLRIDRRWKHWHKRCNSIDEVTRSAS